MRIVDDPSQVFDGTCLVAAPHMDDAVLGCGGTISRLAGKASIRFVYATDGARSPVPPFSRSADARLPPIRMRETRNALARLGVSPDNIRFLGLPDGRLRHHAEQLTEQLAQLLGSTTPDHVLVPFRFDRHPDHLALTRCMHAALALARSDAVVHEYFVYWRWQLLARKDVRKYIGAEHILRVDLGGHAAEKRRALDCFRSQTTLFFDWQTRPILTEQRLSEICRAPELFLRYDPASPDLAIFPRLRTWIRFVHACEPRLKIWKDRAVYLLGGE
jgi:LmbE family N-acetylglucosaminyl deacetylase